MTTMELTERRMSILKAAIDLQTTRERHQRLARGYDAIQEEMAAIWHRQLEKERRLGDLLGTPTTSSTASIILEAAGPEAVAAATAALEAEARAA